MGMGNIAKSVSNGIDRGLDGASGAMDKGLLKAEIISLQQKKSSLISELESEHKAILQSLGRSLYDCRGAIKVDDGQYEDEFEKLDILEARLRQLRSTCQLLKSNMAQVYATATFEDLRCPACNGPITVLDDACSSCGKKIEDLAERFTVCPSCGRVYDENSSFCEECGVKLVGATSGSIMDRRAKLAKSAEPVEVIKCPNCGRQSKQGENFCKGCGSKLL